MNLVSNLFIFENTFNPVCGTHQDSVLAHASQDVIPERDLLGHHQQHCTDHFLCN